MNETGYDMVKLWFTNRSFETLFERKKMTMATNRGNTNNGI